MMELNWDFYITEHDRTRFKPHMSDSAALIFFCIRSHTYIIHEDKAIHIFTSCPLSPPECPAVTVCQSGTVLTFLLWSRISSRVPSGPRPTHLHPASAAPVRNLPWCPSVPLGQAARPHTNEWRPRGTRCWTWRAGTSLTTWLKPTLASSEPGRLRLETSEDAQNWTSRDKNLTFISQPEEQILGERAKVMGCRCCILRFVKLTLMPSVYLFSSQIWRFVLRRTAAHPGGGAHRHPEGLPPTGTDVQHHWGEIDSALTREQPIRVVFFLNKSFLSGLLLWACTERNRPFPAIYGEWIQRKGGQAQESL